MDTYYTELQGTIRNASQVLNTDELRAAIDTFRTHAQEAETLMQQAVNSGDNALVSTDFARCRALDLEWKVY